MKKQPKIPKPAKERGYLWHLWMITCERWHRRRAERILTKQEWSVHFLVMLMAKAARLKNHGVTLVLKHRNGSELHMLVDNPQVQRYLVQDEEIDIRQKEITLDALLNKAEMEGTL